MKRSIFLALSLFLAVASHAQTPVSPIIQPAAGTFTDSVTVTITDATPGATIFYTTDGSIPTTASTVYTGPFQLTSPKIVQAIAVVGSSAISTAAFNVVPAPKTFNYILGTSKPKGLAFTWKQGTADPAAQAVTVWDSSPCPPPAGVPTCHWPVTITTDKPWLIATPITGNTGFSFSVALGTSSLTTSDTGTITLTQAQFKTPTLKIPVTVTVVAAPPPPPPPPPVHGVALTWGAVPSVTGYKLYRSTVTGGPYTQRAALAGVTTFNDQPVNAGQKYCYVVTDLNPLESKASNEVCVTIPTP